MTAHHTVRVELNTRDDIGTQLSTALSAYHPTLSRGPRGHVVVAITLPADSVVQAVQTAVAVVAQATGADVLAVEALPAEESTKRAGLAPVPPLLSVSEAAAQLGVSRQAVLQRIDSGSLPATRIGSTWAVPGASLIQAAQPPARRRTSLSDVAATWEGEGRWPKDTSTPEDGPGVLPSSAPLPLPLGANVPIGPM
ncbi:DNA binding domain-containing protein, excisionase family [Sanguibacter gelidistatuariae]|uniref:DNA binding domain-containing protein, excisionase family n=1 Tax=Sanguibacter gelidistatuariae TaxID=1814289 RepID=A0A1G6HH13_9MICO|nr:helix-turn-helix domain-containing protein [Sanguibacter gelidistatuariae]SDB93225.1 DNA binding domain-containing protein, excisionase family [Sanguibacter gelidistatuariae]